MRTTGLLAFGRKNLSLEQKKLVKLYIEYARNIMPKEVIKMAGKMNVDVNEIFKNILFSSKRELYESSVSNFLGVYGNYIATEYLSKSYSNIENEKEIETINGKTFIDIYFEDKDIINLCEVKVVPQILLSLKAYKNYKYDGIKREDFEFSKGYSQKRNFVMSGKKLIKQIEILDSYRQEHKNVKINFINFENSHIDNKILIKLKEFNVNIITIPVDVYEILDKVNGYMSDIYTYGRNLMAEHSLNPVS